VREQRIVRFTGDAQQVRIEFDNGEVLERRAIFFNTGCRQQSELARQLGCEIDERGAPKVNRYAATSVPGLYVAGDASRDVLQAIVGAGEGCEAAVAINKALLAEDLDLPT
jgi:thioredoxin reductase